MWGLLKTLLWNQPEQTFFHMEYFRFSALSSTHKNSWISSKVEGLTQLSNAYKVTEKNVVM